MDGWMDNGWINGWNNGWMNTLTGLDLAVFGSLLVRVRLSSGRGHPHMNWGIRRPPRELGGVYYSLGWRDGHTARSD